MARYRGPVCRLCRREGEKLFLKGERCYTSKCALERREGVPGQHAKGRQSHSDFKVRLREKQKVKRIFGILEAQCESYFDRASTAKGSTGTEFLQLLERRLDNIVYRLGFGASRKEARQLVRHGHVKVNGEAVNVPSFAVGAGDTVELSDGMKPNVSVQASLAAAQARVIPEWLTLEKEQVKGVVKALPTREQMPQGINEQLIVEHYSR